jgi:hypothetical protein
MNQAGTARSAELAAIARFLASNGATRCPAAYVAPTATDLSRAEDARRLSRMQPKPPMTVEQKRAFHWAMARSR